VVELFGLTTILLPVKPPGFHVKVPPETEAEAIRVAD
jgi:hypothetical protein